MENNQQETQDTEILETVNHNSKYGAQLVVVQRDFAQLFENSDMKKHLASLKRKYSGLKIESLNDVEIYEEIKKAISVVRPLRTATDKKRKEINKEAKEFIESVNDMGAKIQAEIAKVEDHLWAEREKFEKLQKEEAERAEKEAKEKLDSRVNELKENGLQFDGIGSYAINDINVGIQFIQELPDSEYQTFLSKVQKQNELNIAEQKRKEEEAKAETEKQEAIRKENERLAAELKEKEDALNAKLKEIADAEKALADKEKAQKELEEKQEKERKEEERRQKEYEQEVAIGQKMSRYEDLGMKYSYVNKRLEWSNGSRSIYIDKDIFLNEPENLFTDTEEGIKLGIKEKEEHDAKVEAERIAKQKADAEEAERKRKELLSEQQLFAEWLSELQRITPPTLNDEVLKVKIINILNLIKQAVVHDKV